MVCVSRRGHTVSIRLYICPVRERDVLRGHLSDLKKEKGCWRNQRIVKSGMIRMDKKKKRGTKKVGRKSQEE